MKELDYTLAQARRLFHHYNNLDKDCNSEVVAQDFASLVEMLEYVKTSIDISLIATK